MALISLISYAVFGLMLLFAGAIAVIRAQPYDDNTIRSILLPADCSAPCFMGIRPGTTQIRETYALLEKNPWVGGISSHIDSGCCTIALNWRWNGKQPASLENGNNTIYFTYDPDTGIQTVQNIAIHTRIAAGYTILVLGAWPLADSGALRGLDHAYVEVFYRQHAVYMTTTLPCPLTRWRLWEAPMTLALNTDSWGVVGMKHMRDVC
jgi:hypothetical protein